eukprot:9500852-Pyramimonas_sp.AAC.1
MIRLKRIKRLVIISKGCSRCYTATSSGPPRGGRSGSCVYLHEAHATVDSESFRILFRGGPEGTEGVQRGYRRGLEGD